MSKKDSKGAEPNRKPDKNSFTSKLQKKTLLVNRFQGAAPPCQKQEFAWNRHHT